MKPKTLPKNTPIKLPDSKPQDTTPGVVQNIFQWLKRVVTGRKVLEEPKLEPTSGSVSASNSPGTEEEKAVIPSLKALYCEYIAIAKDSLDVAWKLAPIALLPPGLLVWDYLRLIHWEDLFLDSAMTIGGLAFLFLAALLLAFAILLQFAIPSLALIGVISLHDANKTVSREVASTFRWSMLSWLIAIIVSLFYDKGLGILLLMALSAPLTFFAIRSLFKLNALRKDRKQLGPHMANLLWIAGALFPMTLTTFPLLIGLEIARHIPDIERWESLGVVVTCILISIISLSPGFVYLNLRTTTIDRGRAIKGAVIAGFVMSYVILMTIAFFSPVSSKVLSFAGIYSNELRTFQVRELSLASSLKTVGFALQAADEKALAPDAQKTAELPFVKGYVRYGFGGIKLLCTTAFDPAGATRELVKKARNENRPDPGTIGGQGCVSATNTELREVKRTGITS